MSNLVNLKNIRNVELKAKVVPVKNAATKIITSVRFDYEGEPSMMENILVLESQNQPIEADFRTPQYALDIEDLKK